MVKNEEKWQRDSENTGSWSQKTLVNLVSLFELSNQESYTEYKEIQTCPPKQLDINQLEVDLHILHH